MSDNTNDFFIVAKEPGAEHPALPTWANNVANPAKLASAEELDVEKRLLTEIPGAFQLLNVFSEDECIRLIDLAEELAFLPDAAVSLPRTVRHNDSMTWVVDDETVDIIWRRISGILDTSLPYMQGKRPLGVNARFRFYRYSVGDYFKPHLDGDWPGSRVINGSLERDAYPDRYSRMTFLILLNEDFEGGATQLFVNKDNPTAQLRNLSDATVHNVRTPTGGVLCFPHGRHPLSYLHSAEQIMSGVKYIIRTDLLFEN
ncbi:oxidoreductase [Pseudoalteromonas rubra]|uniref:Oxidoreductase n=1 Tax=Pseudoalteromonas rubra TaxID=43658 RepID=A0A0U3H0P9_9GAMM|nr:oxidoreductase [Pseudoalteromonas rubra]ALU44915.1 oxidoreductase [Pseudoalteromonas rubra]